MYIKFWKNFFDILGAIILFPFFIILYIVIGLIIKIEDGGSILYLSDRLGKNGKIFKMYKFRTMKENSLDVRNKDGSTFNAENDPRLTKIGKFIRKSSIDEIPQILNVLKGDMSFVGPRPDLSDHFEIYTENEREKLKLLPGITGYNQSRYRNSILWKERLKCDVFYVQNVSIFLDIKIIFWTFNSLLRRKNVF